MLINGRRCKTGSALTQGYQIVNPVKEHNHKPMSLKNNTFTKAFAEIAENESVPAPNDESNPSSLDSQTPDLIFS